MNGYVAGGYVVVLGSLGLYAATLVARLRRARNRRGARIASLPQRRGRESRVVTGEQSR
jgi:hypothetical protein